MMSLALLLAAMHMPEQVYAAPWCAEHHGQPEVVTTTGAMADCVTETHAVEFYFSAKWAESIGQSLLYARELGKSPGVVLILEQPDDCHHLVRWLLAASGLDISLWVIGPYADRCHFI